MGWIFTHKDENESAKDFFSREFTSHKSEIIACSQKGSTYYLVYHNKENGQKFAIVCLTSRRNKEYHNFGYKDMDESMGPYFYNCPMKLINMLSPTDNQNAITWRQKCIENATLNKKSSKVGISDFIIFDKSISFGRHGEFKHFRPACIPGRRNIYDAMDDNLIYKLMIRIPKSLFTTRKYDVIEGYFNNTKMVR